jgi:hypothetical protein
MSLNEGVLYVLTDYYDGTDSMLLQTRYPSVSVPLSSYWSDGDEVAADGVSFDAAPSALRTSAGSTTLWAISVNTDELYYFKDIVSTTAPTLTSPADGKTITVNPITGKSYDVTLAWERPDYGRSYTYDIYMAFDSGFKEYALKTTEATTSSSPAHIVGPSGVEGGGSDSTKLEFMPGTTYYWKVRVKADYPVQSPWSEIRSFTIEPGEALVPTVLSPANGGTGISTMPSFSWNPVGGATDYQFKLADNVALDSPIVDVTVKSTGYAVTTALTEGKTYYWAVKPMSPVTGAWSAIANFTVKEKAVAPTPPVVVQEVPAPVINIPPSPAPQEIVIPPAPEQPAPIAPAYIWAVIIIGAVLVIAVIILIVRTRRVT